MDTIEYRWVKVIPREGEVRKILARIVKTQGGHIKHYEEISVTPAREKVANMQKTLFTDGEGKWC